MVDDRDFNLKFGDTGLSSSVADILYDLYESTLSRDRLRLLDLKLPSSETLDDWRLSKDDDS